MKKVYVVNLDKKRILILMGAILSVVGAAFYAGSMQKSSGYTAYEDFNSIMGSQNSANDTGSNYVELTPLEPIGELNVAIPNSKPDKPALRTQEDPFLDAPPRPVTRQNSTQSTQTTQIDKPATSNTPRTVNESSKSTNKYYTIQLGAYKRETDAKRYAEELSKQGVQARVERGIRFWLVYAGKTKDKTVLEPLYKKIHDSLKLEAIVVYRTLS
ncbi:MAG: SPOR domain-containing protein [Leptospirales bacterium]